MSKVLAMQPSIKHRAELERQLGVARENLRDVRFRGNQDRSTHHFHEIVGDILTEIRDIERELAQ